MHRLLIVASSLDSRNAGFRLRMLNGILYNVNTFEFEVRKKRLSRSILFYLLTSNYDALVLHKSIRPAALLAAIICRMRRKVFIYDSCDPPYLNLNIPTFSLQVFKYLWFIISYSSLIALSSSVFVPSQSLFLSIRHDSVYLVPDVNDQHFPLSHQPVKSSVVQTTPSQFRNLVLLWYGSEGSSGSFQGIDELIASFDEVLEVKALISKFIIVSNLSSEKHKQITLLFAESSIPFVYKDWSTLVLSESFLEADFVYLPSIDSIKTFYKSDNRVSLANMHGALVVCGSRQSYLDYIIANQCGARAARLSEGIKYFRCLDQINTAKVSAQAHMLNESRKKIWIQTLKSIFADI